jgi:hypothetical protein
MPEPGIRLALAMFGRTSMATVISLIGCALIAAGLVGALGSLGRQGAR